MGTKSWIYFTAIRNTRKVKYVIVFYGMDGSPGYVGLILAGFLKCRMNKKGKLKFPIKSTRTHSYGHMIAQYLSQQLHEPMQLESNDYKGDPTDFMGMYDYHVCYNFDNDNISVYCDKLQSEEECECKEECECECEDESENPIKMSVDEFQRYCYYYNRTTKIDDIDELVQNEINRLKWNSEKRWRAAADDESVD